jgi:hypothetical protein
MVGQAQRILQTPHPRSTASGGMIRSTDNMSRQILEHNGIA